MTTGAKDNLRSIDVNLISVWGTDREIAEAAWVSTNTAKREDEDVTRVISKTLAPYGHGVPFEAVYVRFWVRCPRYIEAQILKHRMSSINGASARYKTVTTECLALPEDFHALLSSEAISEYEEIVSKAKDWYARNLSEIKATNPSLFKRAKEVLRGILPQAQMTELHITMNLRAFANFYKQRSDEGAQLEIQQISEMMLKSIEEANVIPVSLQALKDQNWKI